MPETLRGRSRKQLAVATIERIRMMAEVGDLIPFEDAEELLVDGMAQVGEAMNRIEGLLVGIPHNVPIKKAREVRDWLDDLRRDQVKRVMEQFADDAGGEPADADDTTNESEQSK